MSTTATDTPDLDEKKGNSTNKQPINYKGFITALIGIIIFIIVYFSFSGYNLYVSKLAQANILPTDVNCAPYTNATAEVAQIISNIFSGWGKDNATMKIRFDATNSAAHHTLIDPLRRAIGSNTHFLAKYMVSIVEHLLQFNYSAINMYFNSLNTIPETAQVAISPIISGIFFMMLLFAELFYFVYVWFKSMSVFFKGADNTPVELFSNPINYGIACGFVVLFMFILFLVIAAVPLLNVGVLVACLLTCVGYKASYVDGGGAVLMAATMWQVVKDVFKYHKGLIVWFFTLLFIMATFANLGMIAAIITIVLVILMSYGKISGDLFKQETPEHIAKMLSAYIPDIKQATKTCVPGSTANTTKNTAFGLLRGFFDLFKTPPAATQKGGSTTSHANYKLDREFLMALRDNKL